MPAAIGRLTRRPEFLRVARGGRKWVTPGLILQACGAPPEGGAEECRVGFTASRKVGSAVERNRARRRLRAAVTAIMPAHAARPFDYVVIARRETLRRPSAELTRDLATALRRLGVYRPAEGGMPAPRASAG